MSDDGIRALLASTGMNKSRQSRVNLEQIEDEIRNIPREPIPPPPVPIRPLSADAKKLVSEPALLATKQCVEEFRKVAVKYRDEALENFKHFEEWGEALIREAEKAANEIAESHDRMRKAFEALQSAMREVVSRPHIEEKSE